jgi:hypothetical protein
MQAPRKKIWKEGGTRMVFASSAVLLLSELSQDFPVKVKHLDYRKFPLIIS